MADQRTPNVNIIYQRIGEFVVSFQWLEDTFRETGCFLLDPTQTDRTQLRDLTNFNLLNKVKELYRDKVSSLPGPAANDYCDSFDYVVEEAHKIRRSRNKLLHAAMMELNAGGEVVGLLAFDLRTSDPFPLSEESVQGLMKPMARVAWALTTHLKQLHQLLGNDSPPTLNECGLPFHRDGLPRADSEEE